MFSNTLFVIAGSLLLTVVLTVPTPNQIENCGSYADIVFVLDSSGSIDDTEYTIMQQFVEDVVAELGDGDNARFGYTVYHNSAWAEFYLNDHSSTAAVLQTISSLTRASTGGTNTHTGLAMARSMFNDTLGDRAGHTNIIIVLTDGQSSSSTSTISEAETNKQEGIRMISIGVGTGYDLNELNAMASDPISENVFTVHDFSGLTTILADVCEAVEGIEIADPESDRIEGGGRYDCSSNNPCSPSLRTTGQFYYRHTEAAKFVQCTPCGACFEMSCGAGSEWNATLGTCGCVAEQAATGYNCGDRNPCTSRTSTDPFYFPHTSSNKFVQCSQWGQCWEMPCGPATVWDQASKTCVHAP